MRWWSKTIARRDGLDVYNARAYTSPIPAAKDLSFELEYAAERNSDLLHSDAWSALRRLSVERGRLVSRS